MVEKALILNFVSVYRGSLSHFWPVSLQGRRNQGVRVPPQDLVKAVNPIVARRGADYPQRISNLPTALVCLIALAS